MAKRRNHGQALSAGALTQRALEKRIPRDRLRLTYVRVVWPDIVPATVKANAWPTGLRDDELVISVRDNQWLHELMYLRADLIARVQQRCPRAGIERIRLRLGQPPEDEPAPPELAQPPETTSITLPAEPSPETLDALERVRDGKLRQVIATARVALSRRRSHA